MIGIIGFFITTFILSFLVQMGFESALSYIAGEEQDGDEQEPGLDELLKPFLYFALRVTAIIVCAILPALKNGGLLIALIYGVVVSLVIEAIANISNIEWVKHMGIKTSVVWSFVVTISNLIVTTGGYFIARLIWG